MHPKPSASARGPFENGLIGTVAKAWRDCTIGHPGRIDCGTPQAVVEEIEQLRRQRWTGKQITAETGVSSPRFYVRRDVAMLQQIPQASFLQGAESLRDPVTGALVAVWLIRAGSKLSSFFLIHSNRTIRLSKSWPLAERRLTVASITPTKSPRAPTNVLSRS